MDLDRFVNEQNIERFRRLAAGNVTNAERAMLLTLLAEEGVKATELQKARLDRPSP